MEKKLNIFTLRLDDKTLEQLNTLANKMTIKKSQLVRTSILALLEFYDKNPVPEMKITEMPD